MTEYNLKLIAGDDCPSCGRDNRHYDKVCSFDECPGVQFYDAAPETAAERDRLKVQNAELLEALHAALDVVSSDYTVEAYEFDPADIRSQVQTQIEQAIAKAEGK